MATLTAAAVSISSFTGLRASSRTVPAAAISATSRPTMALNARASLREAFGAAVVATAAGALITSNALAIDVLLGASDGSLIFEPNNFSIASGETIVFKNNAGYPHNVVFDEDEVPAGVNAAEISMKDEDLLNGPGETFSTVLKEKGTYTFYCSPHQGAGMVGKVTVN